MERPIQLNEALKEFEDQFDAIEHALISNMHDDIQQEKQPSATDPDLRWVQDEVYKQRMQYLTKDRRRTLKHIHNRRAYLKNPRAFHNTVTDAMIEHARAYPIEEIFPYPTRAGMGQCPFHEDKTPSCSIRRYNRYKCFGCGAHGDVIDLYMKVYDVPFITAVRALQ